jgi:phage terminase small subunit
MALTAKQSRFSELVAGGLNQTESYRRAYDAQGMSDAAIRVEACRLAKHPKVVAHVELLRKQHPKVKRVVPELSNEWLTMELMDLATSPYSTTTTKASALKVLSRIRKLP